MKVLVIPEDPTYDQYVLKPIVERIFKSLGRTARIDVLRDPRLKGVSQALAPEVIARIVERFPMIDLFLVLVDRDGDAERRAAQGETLEEAYRGRLITCFAIEEIEVWMLALHRDRLSVSWREVRAERHPKERFAEPFLAQHAPRLGPGRGRKWAMRALGPQWQGVLKVCPELAELQQKIAGWALEAVAE